MAQLGRNPFAVQETQEVWVQSLGQEDPQSGEWPPAAMFSPNPRDRGVWWVQTGCCKGLGVTERVAHTYKRVLGERLSRVRLASGRVAAKTRRRRRKLELSRLSLGLTAWCLNSPRSKTSKSRTHSGMLGS